MISKAYENYLSSDSWKTRRVKKLVSNKARCSICKGVSFHNDIHHITYRNLGREKMSELKVLCRPCHEVVHRVLELYPSIKKKKNIQWNDKFINWFESHFFGVTYLDWLKMIKEAKNA